MALEDAWVLSQLLTSGSAWDEELLTRYYKRRIDRVRMVVEASVQIGQWQLDDVPGDVPGLLAATMETAGREGAPDVGHGRRSVTRGDAAVRGAGAAHTTDPLRKPVGIGGCRRGAAGSRRRLRIRR